MLYYITVGEFPFDDKKNNEKDIAMEILNKKIDFNVSKWSGKCKELKHLIERCLEKEIKDRITIDEILNHEFITKTD